MSRPILGAAALVALSGSLALADANQLGLNVNYLNDSDNTPLLADLMRTYRYVNTTGSLYNANNAALDSNGWATSDAWYFMGDPAAIKHGDGTYAIKFNGVATITLGATAGQNGSVVNQVYDPATNTTTALLRTKTSVDLTDVRFTNTQRTSSSATNTGVTNIEIMRPTTPGGSTPYSFDTTFTNQAKAIAGKVGTLRFMDYLATNNNTQVNWTDRVAPTQVKLNPSMPSSSRGLGGPLELAVQMGNETGKDIWVNVPAGASDDYVTKMAQTIKFGSDGVNPYTSPQRNPVYKPLSPNLHVYVEYSNETWNTSFKQFNQIATLAQNEYDAELASGTAGPLTYAPTTNKWYLTERYNALRTKQISDTFGNVFGDGSLTTTVRPVLGWQYGNGNDTANQAQIVLDGYFNNTKGNFVANPTPINKYIYGGGSAMYYSPTDKSSVDALISTSQTQTDARFAKIKTDIAYSTTFGIHRVAYEGGLSLDPGTSSETTDSLATKMAALADARMKQVVVSQHNMWTNEGGELLVYYFASDQYKFAMSDENYSTNTGKLQGLDQLNGTAATHDWTVGTPLSRSAATTIRGKQYSIRDVYGSTADAAIDLGAGNWTSYLVNIPAGGGTYTLTAHYKTSGAVAAFQLILGGAVLADFTGLRSDAAYAATQGISLTLPEGVTSLRVLGDLSNSSTFSLNDITFTPSGLSGLGGLTAIPEPTSLAAIALGGAAVLRRRRK